MTRWTKTNAFAEYGVTLRNTRWSWSGRSPDGKTVVLIFWADGFKGWKTRPIVYDGSQLNSGVVDRLGNQERIENIQWALDNLDGIVRVIIAKSKDVTADPRNIEECWPQTELLMRIKYFNTTTGAWIAESV